MGYHEGEEAKPADEREDAEAADGEERIALAVTRCSDAAVGRKTDKATVDTAGPVRQTMSMIQRVCLVERTLRMNSSKVVASIGIFPSGLTRRPTTNTIP